MMCMLTEAMASVTIDVNARMKKLWLTNALDGSEDYLVSERLFALVGDSLVKKRELLMREQSPKTLQALIKSITPPKGVHKKGLHVGETPDDKGSELLDCEGDFEPHEAMESDTMDDEEEDSSIAETAGDTTQSTNEDVQATVQSPSHSERELHTEQTQGSMDPLLKAAMNVPEIAKNAKFLANFHI